MEEGAIMEGEGGVEDLMNGIGGEKRGGEMWDWRRKRRR